MTGLAQGLFAVFVVLMFIVSLAKSAPLIARGMGPIVGPVFRPLGYPLRIIGRHLRLPAAAVICFAVFLALGMAIGAAYVVFLSEQPRTCAQVDTVAGPVYTCENGHPYHELIVRSGTL